MKNGKDKSIRNSLLVGRILSSRPPLMVAVGGDTVQRPTDEKLSVYQSMEYGVSDGKLGA